MRAEFEVAMAAGGGLQVGLQWWEAPPGLRLAAPQARVKVSNARGVEVAPGEWIASAEQGAADYLVALPEPGPRPGPEHGAASATLREGVLVACEEVLLPTFPPGCTTGVRSGGWPVLYADGLVVAGAGLQSLEACFGRTSLGVTALPEADSDQLGARTQELARQAARWEAFRMSLPPGCLRVLLSREGDWLAMTPGRWCEVGVSWGPLAVAHGLLHGTGLCARPASGQEWWAHEGVAEYCARVEAARTSLEADRELRTWLRAAYAEHARLTVAPAELNGDRLPMVGALLVHALSCQVLAYSGGFRSLFHLVDVLNGRFCRYSNGDLGQVLFELTGRDFADFWERHVTGREALPEKVCAGL